LTVTEELDVELVSCQVDWDGEARVEVELDMWGDSGAIRGRGLIRDGWLLATIAPGQERLRGWILEGGGVAGQVRAHRGPLEPRGTWRCTDVTVQPVVAATGRVDLGGVARSGEVTRAYVRSCADLAEVGPGGSFAVDVVPGPCSLAVLWSDADGEWCQEVGEEVDADLLRNGLQLAVDERYPFKLCEHLFEGMQLQGWYETLEMVIAEE
jgi:hypothetical protein